MNNLSSFFGLVDAKIRASDKDLPVQENIFKKIDPKPSFSKVKNLKVGSFLRAREDLEGLRSQKNSKHTNKSVDRRP